MILGHLPGLQDDAFSFYYAWTTRTPLFFLFCIIPIALPHYLRRCFTSWEGPDIACFSDAQLRSFTPRSLDPHGRAVVGSTLLAPSSAPPVGPWSTIYRLPTIRVLSMTIGVNKTITLNRFDDRDHKAPTQDRTPL